MRKKSQHVQGAKKMSSFAVESSAESCGKKLQRALALHVSVKEFQFMESSNGEVCTGSMGVG